MASIAPRRALWIKRGAWLVAIVAVGVVLAKGADRPADPHLSDDAAVATSVVTP